MFGNTLCCTGMPVSIVNLVSLQMDAAQLSLYVKSRV